MHPCSLLAIQLAKPESSRFKRGLCFKIMTSGLHMHEPTCIFASAHIYMHMDTHTYTHTLPKQFTFWRHWVPTWWSQKQWLDDSVSHTSVLSGKQVPSDTIRAWMNMWMCRRVMVRLAWAYFKLTVMISYFDLPFLSFGYKSTFIKITDMSLRIWFLRVEIYHLSLWVLQPDWFWILTSEIKN